MVALFTASAQNTKVLFENADSEMLSWSVAFSVKAGDIQVKAGDVIEVTVAEIKADCEWPKFGFENASGSNNYPTAFEMWEHRSETPYVARYTVTDADLEMLSGDFDVKGDGVRLTRAVFISNTAEELPEGHKLIYSDDNAPMLSWSVLCSVTAAQVEGIKAGDAFEVTVEGVNPDCEWPKFGFENGEGANIYPEEFEMWGEKSFPYVATYNVTADDVNALSGGFDIKGDGVKVTRVVFISGGENPNTDIVLWKGESTLLTWGAGPTVAAGKASQIEAGDEIVVNITEIASTGWPKVVARSEDGWDEIFTIELFDDETKTAELPLSKSVTVTEEMLPLLSAGFNFGGEGASIDKVTLVKKSSSVAIEEISAATPAYVSVYTISGVCLRSNVKAENAVEGLPAGLYIAGGKKLLVK